MEQKLVQRCETEVDGDACKASYTVASHVYCKTNRWLSTLRQITAKGSTAVSTAILKLVIAASRQAT